MNWIHMGVVSRSEANADRFFGALLGLTKSEPKTLPAEISTGCFGVEADLPMINYTGDNLAFEVFIDPDRETPNDRIVHACIKVEDRDEFLTRCEAEGVEVRRVPKGERLLVFIRDYDENLYEIQTP